MFDPVNDAPCRRHPADNRPCQGCRGIRERHPEGYDPRPAADIPEDELDVEAWALPREDLVPPEDMQRDDDQPALRRWYAQAQAEQRTRRVAQARERLAAYQARHAS